MKGLNRRGLFLLAASAAASAAALLVLPPVLGHLDEPGSVAMLAPFTLRNPFRDRGPEKAAGAFLESLNAADCVARLLELEHAGDRERARHTCDREREFRPVAWRLYEVVEKDENLEVTLSVTRRHAAVEYDVPVQVLLDRRAGGWAVVDFSAVY